MPRPRPLPPKASGRPPAHRGRPLDDGAGARVGEDRQPVGHRVLAGSPASSSTKDSIANTFKRRAETTQRRRPHRRFRDQVVADPLCGEIIERLAVARAGAGLGRGFGDRRRPAAVGQRLGGEEIAAAAGPVGVLSAPDLGGPVGRPPTSPSTARTVITIAGLTGSKPNSSSRRQRTRTGVPGSASRSLPRRPPRRRRRYGRNSRAPARDARQSRPDRASGSAPAPRATGRPPANVSTVRACRCGIRRRRRMARSRRAHVHPGECRLAPRRAGDRIGRWRADLTVERRLLQ